MKIVLGHNDYVGAWVSREIGKLWVPGAGRTLGWIDDEGSIAAGVTFTNFDGCNVWLDVAAKPKSRWLRRAGLCAIFHYCFVQLGCERASAAIPESNAASRKLAEQAGFELETSLERAAPNGERMMLYRMFREDCKWVKL